MECRCRIYPRFFPARTSGMGLIEVLVALLILAIGLLGVLGMQNKGLQLNQAGHYQSQAMFLAQDVLERIRANKKAIDSYTTDFSTTESGTSCQINTATCNPVEMAASDLAIWKTALTGLLPSGEGRIEVSKEANGLYKVDVHVRYFVGRLKATDTSDDGKHTYQLSAQI